MIVKYDIYRVLDREGNSCNNLWDGPYLNVNEAYQFAEKLTIDSKKYGFKQLFEARERPE